MALGRSVSAYVEAGKADKGRFLMGRALFSTVAALSLVGMMCGGVLAQEEKFVTIGTGGQTGVYYVVGQSICKLVNRGAAEHGIKCTAPSTGGSVANINAIKEGSMDMGVAQSDWQSYAYNGTPEYEGGEFADLRAVFSVSRRIPLARRRHALADPALQ
jgi:TRAP transporter TAXI family solute receptor